MDSKLKHCSMEENRMNVSNKTYNTVKWFVSVVLPATGVLVGSIGQACNWGNTDLAVTIITAVTTFLGSCMMMSSNSYHKELYENDGK